MSQTFRSSRSIKYTFTKLTALTFLICLFEKSEMSFTWMTKIFMQSPQSKILSRHVVIAKKRNDKVVILSLPCFV